MILPAGGTFKTGHNEPMNTARNRLIDVMADVETIAVLAWLCDVILLIARFGHEADPLHLVVSLGAASFLAALVVVIGRRYQLAVALLLLTAAAVVWLVRLGPVLRPRQMLMAAAVVAVTIAMAVLLRPPQMATAIPAAMLAHQWVVGSGLASPGPAMAALVLTPIMPWLFRVVRSRPAILLGICAAGMVASVIAGVVLRERLESQRWAGSPVAKSANSNINVVLVVIDTLRADRIGFMGYRTRRTTPALDALASQAIVFRRAYASSSWTLPSVASMFTGLPAGAHGLVTGRETLPRRRPTIAERLHDAGYFTSGISANFALDRDAGFSRGFDDYAVLWRLVRGTRRPVPSMWDDLNSLLTNYYGGWYELIPDWNWKPHAAAVSQRAMSAIDRAPRDRPLFLFVHFVDPHAPCDSRDRGFKTAAADTFFDERWSVAYDGEIHALDRSLGELIQHVDRKLDSRHTLLIITADHGEQLGESGQRGHGNNLSEATIRVPLLVRPPDGFLRLEADAPFPTSKVFDLIAAAAGLSPEPRHDGVIHSSLVVGNSLQRAVSDGTYKLIQHWQLAPQRLAVEELFHLPDEEHNVLAGNESVAVRLRASAEADPLPHPTAHPDSTLNKLRALGYLR